MEAPRILTTHTTSTQRNDRYKEEGKGYETLKLKFGNEAFNSKETRPAEATKSRTETQENMKRSASTTKKEAAQAQSLTNPNVMRQINKEEAPPSLTMKPKFVRHKNSIHEDPSISQNINSSHQFHEMYSSLGPYGAQRHGARSSA